MSPSSPAARRPRTIARRPRAAGRVAPLLPFGTALFAMLLIGGLSGCGVIRTINNVRHAVDGNRAAIKSFTQNLKSAEATPFQATYVTTGDSPTTVTYSVQPPKEVAFMQTAAEDNSGTADLDLVSNSSGEYSCSSEGGTASWSCTKLGKAEAIAQNEIVGLYTPAHWVTFLEALSITAGFAGDKVTNSTMTVNGFSLNCVNFTTKHEGTSTICTTAQNILGYVKVGGTSTSFAIKSYTSSPPASAFQLPAGAKITKSG
ncbi:MAG TPA: hypothetical protein VFQ44_04495 [Streptosporangiaceae bacterium]|nr:hypothetical protein [Streptosporangiaceae bacterium]